MMTKIDIISGFLGAGKTTLIKKLVKDLYSGEKIVLIENEFGEISVDGGFLQDSGIEIKEMNSGCICCSLSGDFKTSMNEVLDSFAPDRILIEPSGVGKLSDVMAAVSSLDKNKAKLDLCITVVDAKKCKLYSRNFGEFFDNQVEFSNMILLSRTKNMEQDKINEAVNQLRSLNKEASIITTDWAELRSEDLILAAKGSAERIADLMKEATELHEEHEHHHEEHEHHHEEHEHHHYGHGHHHEEHEHHHEEHHHHHEEHEHHHDGHEHHHEHDGCCSHEHHHHADEIFDSVAFEGAIKLSKDTLKQFLDKLSKDESLGHILRAKGMVEAVEGGWWHFDMVPEEFEVRNGSASYTAVLCIIGSRLNKEKIREIVDKELHIG